MKSRMLLIAVSLSLFSGAAFSAEPTKSYFYAGTTPKGVACGISFVASDDGKHLRNLRLALAIDDDYQGAGLIRDGQQLEHLSKMSRQGIFSKKFHSEFRYSVQGDFGDVGRPQRKVSADLYGASLKNLSRISATHKSVGEFFNSFEENFECESLHVASSNEFLSIQQKYIDDQAETSKAEENDRRAREISNGKGISYEEAVEQVDSHQEFSAQ